MGKNFTKNAKILVAMSGGVDSSVAAALLKEQGYEVIGATMNVWPSHSESGCCGISAAADAKKVCDVLGIPHYTLNFRDYFQQKVIVDFCSEYKQGRTPNPCIRCNQFIKFGKFWQKAKELGCDWMATGHYVRRMPNDECSPRFAGEAGLMPNEGFKLFKGRDKGKDQSYVLYMATQDDLAHTLFPLGEMTKTEVRQLAKKYKLPVYDKAESQEICFIEDDDYVRFLKEADPGAVKPGKIKDMQGNVAGEHQGITFYTLGQRKGIGSHQSKPKYVVKIDRENNIIIVGDQEDLLGKELIADEVTFISGQVPAGSLEITAKIRYNSPEAPATLYPGGRVVFREPQRAITPGQSVVFYQGEEVSGGGIISISN